MVMLGNGRGSIFKCYNHHRPALAADAAADARCVLMVLILCCHEMGSAPN